MAARKRTTRARKRPAKSKGGSGSSASMLALAAIVGIGAFSLWSTSQHKSPQAALTALFQRFTPKPGTTAPAKTEENRPAVASKTPEPATQPKNTAPVDRGVAVGPIPRPAAPVAPTVAPVVQKPVQQTALQPPKPATPLVASVPAAPLTGTPPIMAPRGVNTAAHSPSVVHAKTRLTIHKTAWNRSPAIGTVEKGREMRSYGKTGRWHRVIVPQTNMIGWVHEEQLIGGRDKPDSATLMTGSIAKKKETPKSAPKLSQPHAEQRIVPPRAVGEKH